MAVRLVTGNRIAETSSKGNQEKWLENDRWYKLDLFGYEGLAETVTSHLLQQSNIEELGFRYVTYCMERMNVHQRIRNGCSSSNFLMPGESILTLADLFRKGVGPDWQSVVARQPNLAGKVRWMVEQTIRLTELEQFGNYLTLLFEVDMLFGNVDRHLNNIAVLRRGEKFDYCPIFDFGAGLLSNVRDYPMDIEPRSHMKLLRAQPLNTTFTRQVRAIRSLYGPQLQWTFTVAEVTAALEELLKFYAERDRAYIADRVKTCIHWQAAKL